MLQVQDPLSLEEQAKVKLILIVENDVAIGEFLDLLISHETVHCALRVSHSTEVWSVIKHCKPALFVLNYHLLGTTGIELYDQLHATQELATIPAIILSTNLARHLHEIERRQLVGLSIPLELDEFLETIENLLV